MNFSKLSLFSLVCVGLFSLSAVNALSVENGAVATGNSFDVKSLTWKDRFVFFLVNKLVPETFKDMPADVLADLTAYPETPGVDNFFIDIKQLLIQSKKLTKNSNVPEFDWGQRYTFCFWLICLDFEVHFSTGGTQFIGTETIKSETNVTPTRIEHQFEIPYFNWTCPGFLINVTNYPTETYHLSGNSFALFANITVGFSADYHFVPDVGIQFANTTIHFNARTVRGWLWDITVWDFEGDLIRQYYPEKYNYDEDMMEYWNKNKKQYTKGLQYSLNCFLSNGRSDPANCFGDDSGYLDDAYYRLLNVQFLQTLGLGALLK